MVKRWIRKTARNILSALACETAELSVVIVSDREMRRLNRAWRGRDRTTDVLAFAQEGPAPNLLGDVVISLPTARRQARAAGHPLQTELAILLIHGLLHLLGWDHESGGPRAKAMRRQESRLLRRLQEK